MRRQKFVSDDSRLRLESFQRLNGSSPVPLYAQLATILQSHIRESRSQLSGTRLPSEAEITDYFKISRPTVRQAMSELLAIGLIVRQRGRGTFVAPQQPEHDPRYALGAVPDDDQGVRVRLLTRQRISAQSDVRRHLKLEKGEKVEKSTWLRFEEDEVTAFEERFMSLLQSARSTNLISIRKSVTGHVAQDDSRTAFRFGAVAADSSAANLLNVKKGSPLLYREHTLFSVSGAPLLYGRILFRGCCYGFGFPPVAMASADEKLGGRAAAMR